MIEHLNLTGTSAAIAGTLLGAMLGAGLVLLIFHNPKTRPRNVEARISPYVRQGTKTRAFAEYEWAWLDHPFVRSHLLPPLRKGAALAGRIIGSESEVAARVSLAGKNTTFQAYRMQQLISACAGFLLSTAFAISLVVKHEVSLIVLLGIVGVGTISATLIPEYLLKREVNLRAQKLAREFPTVADLLALAVAAGESPSSAMERISRISAGELSRELGLVVAQVHSGETMDQALSAMGKRSPLPAISRFCETISVALERGTPLADVLRAQAQDAREQAKRELMEIAGKREIWMLIPVIFLLMPLVIVFAIFPGLSVLDIAF